MSALILGSIPSLIPRPIATEPNLQARVQTHTDLSNQEVVDCHEKKGEWAHRNEFLCWMTGVARWRVVLPMDRDHEATKYVIAFDPK
jgi:hypothetical protein